MVSMLVKLVTTTLPAGMAGNRAEQLGGVRRVTISRYDTTPIWPRPANTHSEHAGKEGSPEKELEDLLTNVANCEGSGRE